MCRSSWALSALTYCYLGEPDEATSARRLLAEPDPGAVANPIAADELADGLRGALEHMVEHNLELPVDVLPPLLALRRALGRDWPLPRLCANEDLLEQEAGEHADPFATARAGPANALVITRDRVLGPSLPRPAPRATQRRKSQRRSAKAARKRNRR